jgi:hypothetical protein
MTDRNEPLFFLAGQSSIKSLDFFLCMIISGQHKDMLGSKTARNLKEIYPKWEQPSFKTDQEYMERLSPELLEFFQANVTVTVFGRFF